MFIFVPNKIRKPLYKILIFLIIYGCDKENEVINLIINTLVKADSSYNIIKKKISLMLMDLVIMQQAIPLLKFP